MATTNGVLKYRLVEMKDPIDAEASKKWYARAVQDRTVDFEDFVTHMSEHNSPYSRGVIHGVLIDMLSCLQELVLDGKSVRLGELGLFSLGISGKGGRHPRHMDGQSGERRTSERPKYQEMEQHRTAQTLSPGGTDCLSGRKDRRGRRSVIVSS